MVKIQGYKIDSISMQLHKLSDLISILTSLKASQINHTDSNIYPESTDLIDLSLLAIESGQKGTFDLPQPIYLRNNVAQKSLK